MFRPHYTKEQLKLGNEKLEFLKDGSIKVGDLTFTDTESLYELIFNKNPQNYDEKDLNAYETILKYTKARMGKKTNRVKSSRGKKYLNIIKKFYFGKSKTGSGIKLFDATMNVTNNKTDYVYFDDPNELEDRHQILVAEKVAGNSSHNNEINSIIEELYECGSKINKRATPTLSSF